MPKFNIDDEVYYVGPDNSKFFGKVSSYTVTATKSVFYVVEYGDGSGKRVVSEHYLTRKPVFAYPVGEKVVVTLPDNEKADAVVLSHHPEHTYRVELHDGFGGIMDVEEYRLGIWTKFKVGQRVFLKSSPGRGAYTVTGSTKGLKGRLYYLRSNKTNYVAFGRPVAEDDLMDDSVTIPLTFPTAPKPPSIDFWNVGNIYGAGSGINRHRLNEVPAGSVFLVVADDCGPGDTVLVADISGHRYFIEPDGVQLSVNEVESVLNGGRLTWKLIHLG